MIRALWALSRPRGAPVVGALPLVGYGVVHWDHAATAQRPEALPALVGAWLALHAGSMWLNAALDRDRGPVLWGSPAEVPAAATGAGRAALAVACALAALAGALPAACALGCAALAVLYSHPRVRLKAHPVGGPAVNALGYGLLSPLAGASLAGLPLTPRAGAMLACVVAVVLGAYYAAQVFQQDEDRARGYRTLVATAGPLPTLAAARALLGLGLGGLLALAAAGWLPRACLLAAPLPLWLDAGLAAWRRDPADAGRARVFARRLLLAVIGLVLAALGQYHVDRALGGPVAGRATARGAPPPWEDPRGDVTRPP